MAKSTHHSKFVYLNYDEIQDAINAGKLDIWDLILCKDTKEFVLIREDLSLASIKSKVYRYVDVESAEEDLNSSPETYEGQLVSILYQGAYVAYIVNKNKKDKFYVTPLSVYSGEVNYDTLGQRPVDNLEGTLDEPVTLTELKDGIYKIKGQYQITPNDETVYLSMNSNMFIVQHDENGQIFIKKISAYEICDYIVDKNYTFTTSVVPTTEWLKAQGYVTEGYVDAKIAALDFVTRDEIDQYVETLVIETINNVLETMVDEKIDEKFEATTELELLSLFTRK